MLSEQPQRRISDKRQTWGRAVLRTLSFGDLLTIALTIASGGAMYGIVTSTQDRHAAEIADLRLRQSERDAGQDGRMQEMKYDIYAWMQRIEGKLDRAIEADRQRAQ